MGSRTPPPSRRAQGVLPEDEPFGSAAAPEGPALSLRLRRVADALQVPPSALYDLPNAAGPPSSKGVNPAARDGDMELDGDMENECGALLRAYKRIQNPEERRRLLALVQSVAERT